MKTVKILCQQQGENSTTSRDPVAEIVDEKVIFWNKEIALSEINLQEEINVCVSSDNDMLVKKGKWEIREVELPEWMTAKEWLHNLIKYKYAWGMGVDQSWPENWQRWLALDCEGSTRLGLVKLLKTKTFRSEFRKSMRDQVVKFLDSAPEDRKYRSPLSLKQLDCLVDRYTARDASRIENNLYYSSR